MGTPYVGEVRMFAGNFAPAGWMFCDGQLLPISENEVLFNLIGTTYGGDGQSTFALPNLQSRVPIHSGTGAGLPNYVLAETGGFESVTLTTNQIPLHSHQVVASSNPADSNIPGNTKILASMGPSGITQTPVYRAYDGLAQVTLNAGSMALTGGSQPHDNMQQYLVINYIISLFGVFPSPN